MALYFGGKKHYLIENNATYSMNSYFANVGEISGDDFLILDSANAKLLKTKLYGKTISTGVNGYQLFDANLFSTQSMGGATVTNNGDGSLTISGSGALTSDFWVVFFYSHDEVVKMFKSGKIYANFGTLTYPAITMYLEDKTNNTSIKIGENGWFTTNETTITEEMLASPTTQLVVGIYGGSGGTIIPGTTKPMIYQDGDGTWEPFKSFSYTNVGLKDVGDTDGKVNLSLKTTQLFDTSKIPSFSQGGATIANNGDGSFTISGSGNLTSDVGRDYRFSHEETVKLLRAGNVYSKYSATSNPYATFYLVNGGWNFMFALDNYSSTEVTHVITENMINNPNLELLVAIYGDAGTPITPCTFKPMIYQDGDGTWQEFDNQTHTASVGDGLKGIPIGTTIPDTIANNTTLMDGVYFENGQYWIGDTVDYNSKLLVRRIIEKVYDGNTDIRQGDSSSLYYFNIGNDIDVLSDVNAPIQSDRYKFTQKSLNSMYSGECRFDMSSNNKSVYLYDTSYSTVSDMKAHLAENPLTVQYILNAPISTSISESELESYKSLHSYNGATIVNNDCDAFMHMQYLKNT